MERKVVMLVCLIIVFHSITQAKIDTLYYDKDWNGVDDKVFATYFRVVENTNDTISRKPLKDYYITGELRSEGYYIVLNRYDDSKSIFDGEFIHYYKSGKIEEKGTRIKGKQEGEYTRYTEDGLISMHAHLKNDKFHGIYTEFENDICRQIEYQEGNPLYDYYVVSNKDGLWSKINLKTGKPIYESPSGQEKLVEYKNGETWPYYNKNGIIVAMTSTRVQDYGKYYKISIVIANNSMFPIDFDPKEITADLFYENGLEINDLKVYSADEYMKKVRRRQNFYTAMMTLGAVGAASNAGYSSSTTKTSYSGYSSNHGSASAYSGTVTSTTKTYDGAAAYQAQVIASNMLASYQKTLQDERAIKNEGYLRKNTIYPGQTIAGYIHIARKKGSEFIVNIRINGAIYAFLWTC